MSDDDKALLKRRCRGDFDCMYAIDQVESNRWGFSYATIEEKQQLANKCNLFNIFYLGRMCYNSCLKEVAEIFEEPTLQICEALQTKECWPRVRGYPFEFDYMGSGAVKLTVSVLSAFILIYN